MGGYELSTDPPAILRIEKDLYRPGVTRPPASSMAALRIDQAHRILLRRTGTPKPDRRRNRTAGGLFPPPDGGVR